MRKLQSDELARFSYEAYCEALGRPGKWEFLQEEFREGWRSVANAMSVHVVLSVAAVESADVLILGGESHRLVQLQRGHNRCDNCGFAHWGLLTERVDEPVVSGE